MYLNIMSRGVIYMQIDSYLHTLPIYIDGYLQAAVIYSYTVADLVTSSELCELWVVKGAFAYPSVMNFSIIFFLEL